MAQYSLIASKRELLIADIQKKKARLIQKAIREIEAEAQIKIKELNAK